MLTIALAGINSRVAGRKLSIDDRFLSVSRDLRPADAAATYCDELTSVTARGCTEVLHDGCVGIILGRTHSIVVKMLEERPNAVIEDTPPLLLAVCVVYE
jgi:hypothetical protein